MRRHLTMLVALAATLAMTLPAAASGHSFPAVIDLPNGITPEGIAVGPGTEFFTGSLSTGAIYKGDLRTGEGAFLNEPADFAGPRAALGMKHDPRRDLLWVAGGFLGQGYVYDADTGDTVAVLQLTTQQPTLINDVVVTRKAAYFTDSFQPNLYKVPLDSRGRPDGPVETLPLTGDFVFIGAGAFNGNGIDATPNGKTLILVNSATGALYTVAPGTGEASSIDLGSDTVPNGDGLVLDGKTLYVVQNFFNQIGVVELSADLSSGVVSDSPITSPELKIPSTAVEFGNSLYAVNARFDVAPPGQPAPDVEFQVVRLPKG
ncbi:MAG: superoxide dismutase [Acidimicrobiia bacterium]